MFPESIHIEKKPVFKEDFSSVGLRGGSGITPNYLYLHSLITIYVIAKQNYFHNGRQSRHR
jgi:hypothetical protein